jgi:hypothetical protein
MPRARRLSNSSQEAFSEFCEKHKPLSRRLSQGGGKDMSSNRRSSLAPRMEENAPINNNNKGGGGGKVGGVGSKRALLTRRMSNSSLLSRQQPPSRRTTTATAATKQQQQGVELTSPSERKGPAAASRTSRTGGGGNKENRDIDGGPIDVLQSPTPYWKVAKERGTVSPRETRSSKRRKTTGKKSSGKTLNFDGIVDGIDESVENRKDGLMIFSPPDQIANARREKLELDEKMKAR